MTDRAMHAQQPLRREENLARAGYSKSGLQLALEVQVAPIPCHYLGIPHKRHPTLVAVVIGSFMVDFGSVVAILLTCIF